MVFKIVAVLLFLLSFSAFSQSKEDLDHAGEIYLRNHFDRSLSEFNLGITGYDEDDSHYILIYRGHNPHCSLLVFIDKKSRFLLPDNQLSEKKFTCK